MKRDSKAKSYALLTSCSLAALAIAAMPVSVHFSLEDGVVVASQNAYARGGGEGGESGGGGGESGEHGGGGESGEHGGGGESGGGRESGEHGRGGEAGEHGGGRIEAGERGGERGNFFLFPRSGDDDGTPDQGPGDN